MKANNNEGKMYAENVNTEEKNVSKANETPVYFCEGAGTFAKYINKKGSPVFGMVDRIFNNGRCVGFVHSEGDTWTGELVSSKYIIKCTGSDEIRTAHDSALCYYRNEAEDIRIRILKHYEFDDEHKLKEMLAECELWIDLLTCETKDNVSECEHANESFLVLQETDTCNGDDVCFLDKMPMGEKMLL